MSILFIIALIFSIPDDRIDNLGFAIFKLEPSLEYTFFHDMECSDTVDVISLISDKNGIWEWVSENEMDISWFDGFVNDLPYSMVFLRVFSLSSHAIEVEVNSETGQRLWVRKSSNIVYEDWPTFLLNRVYVVELQNPSTVRIYKQTTEDGDQIKQINGGCFSIVAVSGDFVKIAESISCFETEHELGWARWRKNGKLLFRLFFK